MKILFGLKCILLSMFLCVNLYASTPQQLAKLVHNSGEVADLFGYSVATTDKYIVIGAYENDEGASNTGSVYVYKINTDNSISFLKALQSDDKASNDNFGYSVAIDNNYLVVGAWKENNEGSAYLFKIDPNDNITQVNKFKSNDIQSGDVFGSSVDIYNDLILVGARGEDTGGIGAGSAYLFQIDKNDNVKQIKKIQASTPKRSSGFGSSVAIDNNYIVIGSPFYDYSGSSGINVGIAYVYKIETKGEVKYLSTLYTKNKNKYGSFGNAVAIDGHNIVIGAYKEDNRVKDTGRTYLYHINNDESISYTGLIEANDKKARDYFGQSVAIDGNNIVIGAYGVDADGKYTVGSNYLFKIINSNSIEQVDKFYATEKESGGYVGYSVSIYNDKIVSGAFYSSNDNNIKSGAAYLYQLQNESNDITPNQFRFNINENVNTSSHTISNEIQIKSVSSNERLPISILNGEYSINNGDFTNIQSNVKLDDVIKVRHKSSNAYNFLNTSTIIIGNQSENFKSITKKHLQSPIEIQKVLPNINKTGDKFGSVMASDSKHVVIGVSNQKAVYVYKIKNDLTLEYLSKIEMNDIDKFGSSVAINGQYFTVGAYGDDSFGTNVGSVFVYKIVDDTIVLVDKIKSNNSHVNGEFGTTLAIDNNYIIVGAPNDDMNGRDNGKAYLFKIQENETITEVSQISIDYGNRNYHQFGTSVAIDNEYIAIGASNSQTGRSDGEVFLYKMNDTQNITLIKRFQANIIQNKGFGKSIDIEDNKILIGAYGNEGGGVVYLYEIIDNDISLISSIVPLDIKRGDAFGNFVSLENEFILVGASNKTDNAGKYAGSTYLFKMNEENNITQIAKIQPNDIVQNDRFGSSVLIKGNSIFISALTKNTGVSQGGALYVYKINEKQESPKISINSPLDNSVLTDNNTTLIFSIHDKNNDLNISSPKITFSDGDTFHLTQDEQNSSLYKYIPSYSKLLPNGYIEFNISAKDKLGNENTQQYNIYVKEQKKLSATIIPLSNYQPIGTTIKFDFAVNTDKAIVYYHWDLNGDGTVDRIQTVPEIVSWVYRESGDYNISFKVVDVDGKTYTDYKTITILDKERNLAIKTLGSVGKAPLFSDMTVKNFSSYEIIKYEWDFEGDGIYDFNTTTNNTVHTYNEFGEYNVSVRVTFSDGIQQVVTMPYPLVKVYDTDIGNVSFSISNNNDNFGQNARFTVTSNGMKLGILQFDYDGDGIYDKRFVFSGLTRYSWTSNYSYRYGGTYYPKAKITYANDESIETTNYHKVRQSSSLSINLSSKTVDVNNNESVPIKYRSNTDTKIKIIVEDTEGNTVDTILDWTNFESGESQYEWFPKENLKEGKYFIILLNQNPITNEIQRIDLRATTGGQKFSVIRTSAPREFSPLDDRPLTIDFTLTKAADVLSFIGYSNSNDRIVTIRNRQPLGSGTYTDNWYNHNDEGLLLGKAPNGSYYMYGLWGYTFSDNAVYIKNGVHINSINTIPKIFTPDSHNEDGELLQLSIHIDITKKARLELELYDAQTGNLVATRNYPFTDSGEQVLYFDGKDNSGEYLHTGKYTLGLKAIDENGYKTITHYNIIRIEY